MRGLLLYQAERGYFPERGGAAVAQHYLVAVRQPEQLGEALADALHQRAHRRLPVRGAQIRGPGVGQGGQLLGADLGRAAAEPAVGRAQTGRDLDRGHAASLSARYTSPRTPSAPGTSLTGRAFGPT